MKKGAEEAEEAEARHVPSKKYEYAISYDEYAKASEKRCIYLIIFISSNLIS
jgi:hypothetical protein